MINRVKDKLLDNFTILPNELFNGKLSAKAIGIFAYLCSKDDDWVFYQKEIEEHFNMGTSAISSGLKELEEEGLLLRYRQRNPDGTLGKNIYILYPSEEDFSDKKTYTGKSNIGKTYTGKSNTINKEYNNKDNNNKEKKEEKKEKEVSDKSKFIKQFIDYLCSIDKNIRSKEMKYISVLRKLIDLYGLDDVKNTLRYMSIDKFWKTKIFDPMSIDRNFIQIRQAMIEEKEKKKKKNNESKIYLGT